MANIIRIAVASGKGGTGKTTFSVNLALSAKRPTLLVDCDVEEPNCHLFFSNEMRAVKTVTDQVPKVLDEVCTGCGLCSELCQFNAIATIKDNALVFPELCHSCGLCMSACPENALEPTQRRTGEIRRLTGDFTLIDGIMTVGSPSAPPVIAAVKAFAETEAEECILFDSPPGTACPAVATVRNVDVVLLVTEPTPFGLNDLVLAVDLVRSVGTPFAVAINRSDSGDDRVRTYCKREGIPIIMELPESRRIAEAYSNGIPITTIDAEQRALFADLLDRLLKLPERRA